MLNLQTSVSLGFVSIERRSDRPRCLHARTGALSIEAAKPVARSPLVVRNRDDHDLAPLIEVDDRIREALKHASADVVSRIPKIPSSTSAAKRSAPS